MKYLCDTCVLIDYLRGDEKVQKILSRDRVDGLGMSSITQMELIVGAFNKREVSMIKKAFSDFTIVEINTSVSRRATQLIEQFSKSHGLMIPDALIVATALEYNVPLYTSNVSDFKFIPELTVMPKVNKKS